VFSDSLGFFLCVCMCVKGGRGIEVRRTIVALYSSYTYRPKPTEDTSPVLIQAKPSLESKEV